VALFLAAAVVAARADQGVGLTIMTATKVVGIVTFFALPPLVLIFLAIDGISRRLSSRLSRSR
jgi:hypothetical protein